MSERPMTPEPCEHHWISYGQPGHSPLRWILKCSQCSKFNIERLQEEIDTLEAAAEQRGAVKALRSAADHLGNHGPLTMSHREVYDHLDNRANRLEGDDGNV